MNNNTPENLNINIELSYREDLIDCLLQERGFENVYNNIHDWDNDVKAYVPMWELNILGRVFVGKLETLATVELAKRVQNLLGLDIVCQMLKEIIELEEAKIN